MDNATKKDTARRYYIQGNMTRKEICAIVKITEKTLRGWIKDGTWDTLKDLKTITRPELLNESYEQLAALNKHIKEKLGGLINKELADAKASLRKEIELLSNAPVYQYIEVLDEFLEFVKHDPIAVRLIAEKSLSFIEFINKQRNG